MTGSDASGVHNTADNSVCELENPLRNSINYTKEKITSFDHETVERVFKNNMLSGKGVCAKAPFFSLDTEVLRHLLRIHGMDNCSSNDHAELQYSLLLHVLNGNCFDSSMRNTSVGWLHKYRS